MHNIENIYSPCHNIHKCTFILVHNIENIYSPCHNIHKCTFILVHNIENFHSPCHNIHECTFILVSNILEIIRMASHFPSLHFWLQFTVELSLSNQIGDPLRNSPSPVLYRLIEISHHLLGQKYCSLLIANAVQMFIFALRMNVQVIKKSFEFVPLMIPIESKFSSMLPRIPSNLAAIKMQMLLMCRLGFSKRTSGLSRSRQSIFLGL